MPFERSLMASRRGPYTSLTATIWYWPALSAALSRSPMRPPAPSTPIRKVSFAPSTRVDARAVSPPAIRKLRRFGGYSIAPILPSRAERGKWLDSVLLSAKERLPYLKPSAIRFEDPRKSCSAFTRSPVLPFLFSQSIHTTLLASFSTPRYKRAHLVALAARR